jgi:hypothetical protein
MCVLMYSDAFWRHGSGIFVKCLMALLCYYLWRAHRNGTIMFVTGLMARRYKREEQPVAFWLTFSFYMLIIGVWLLLGYLPQLISHPQT